MQNAVGASAKLSEPVGMARIDFGWAEALALVLVVTANGAATPVQKARLNSDICTDCSSNITVPVASTKAIYGQLYLIPLVCRAAGPHGPGESLGLIADASPAPSSLW